MKHPRRPRAAAAVVALAALVASGLAVTSLPADAVAKDDGSQPRGVRMWDTTDPNIFVGSNRVIELQHQSDPSRNGALIGTFETSLTQRYVAGSGGQHNAFIIRRSTDDGASWSTASTVADGEVGTEGNFTHPWAKVWQPSLFEFPQQLGDRPAGTVYLVGNILDGDGVNGNDYINDKNGVKGSRDGVVTTTEFQAWYSTDGARTWTYDGIIQKGGTFGKGIWEPFISLDGNGKINVTFADERRSAAATDRFSQYIGHIVSNDGGDTWSANIDGSTNYAPGLVRDVASANSADRPGMPTIATMGNGNRIMAYEYGNQVSNSDGDFDARTKISTDGGATWGSGPTDIGKLAVNSSNQRLNSSPYVVWIKGGGPNGTVVLAAKWLVDAGNSPIGTNGDDAGGPIFTSTDYGAGATWGMTTRALVPGGNRYANCYRNYSASLLPSRNGLFVRATSASVYTDGGCSESTDTANPGLLPFTSDFSTKRNRGWNNYGGKWTISGGVLTDTSPAAGNKSVTGNTAWTDYTMQADVKIASSGNPLAGVNIRVNDPGIGVTAQKGYFAGVSATSLVFGKHDGSTWKQLQSVAIPNGVAANTWYHLTVRASGCDFRVQGVPVASTAAPISTGVITDSNCYRAGAVGVSEYNGPAASFRNVSVVAGASPSVNPGTYLAPFASGSEPNWASYGGQWSVDGSTEKLTNASSGAGDKQLYTPSGNWGNYTVQTVVNPAAVTATSAAGVIVRATNAGVGENAFKGYFAGLTRSGVTITEHDGTSGVVLKSAALPGISAGTPYKLTVSVSGCVVTATAVSDDSPTDAAEVTVTDCTYALGGVGVRSTGTAASWQQFTVTS